jgi:minor histocompatibility antigen H13
MADSEPSLIAQVLGNAAYAFTKVQPLLPVYLHMIVASLFPIYAAAHASLTRPSTAAKPPKKGRKEKKHEGEDEDTDDEDEDEEPENEMEGLSPRHIILFPLFAGISLATLYFLIKWLKDPTILSKALNAYFAVFGFFAVTKLVSDVLDIGHSIIFPRRHALRGALYHIKGNEAKAVPVAGNIKDGQPITTPLPGFLARIPLSTGAKEWLWADRAMPGNKWTLKVFAERVLVGKAKVGPHTIFGAMTALATLVYFNLVDKTWYLTNLLGFSFAYGSIQVISPTTFATGSAILVGLFFYDIYMVFFTPLMVTVASSLDVPIKLMFPKPGTALTPRGQNATAMLGLGDIIIPGLMIGLALRFDLHLFYLRRQKRIPAKTESVEDIVEKAEFTPLAGRWSDHFWTHSLTGRPLWTAAATQGQQGENEEAPFTFPKTYFNAALVGYIGGLVATFCALHLMNHAQPALLWLVPGVLISLWLTALVRGELGLMWHYSEEIVEEEAKDGKDEKKRTQQWIKDEDETVKKQATAKSRRPERELFSFSIEAPRKAKRTTTVDEDGKKVDGNGTTGSKDEHEELVGKSWAGSASKSTATQDVDLEPAGKRLRVR